MELRFYEVKQTKKLKNGEQKEYKFKIKYQAKRNKVVLSDELRVNVLNDLNIGYTQQSIMNKYGLSWYYVNKIRKGMVPEAIGQLP